VSELRAVEEEDEEGKKIMYSMKRACPPSRFTKRHTLKVTRLSRLSGNYSINRSPGFRTGHLNLIPVISDKLLYNRRMHEVVRGEMN